MGPSQKEESKQEEPFSPTPTLVPGNCDSLESWSGHQQSGASANVERFWWPEERTKRVFIKTLQRACI